MTQEELKRKIDELVTERTYLSAKHNAELESLKKQGMQRSGTSNEMHARILEINAQLKPLHQAYGSDFHNYNVNYKVLLADALGNEIPSTGNDAHMMRSTIDCKIDEANRPGERPPNYEELYADLWWQLHTKYSSNTMTISKIVRLD